VLLAAPATAQPTTEDGIRAVLRGDYQAAVRILRPFAEDAARPDPLAQFFLAVVYQNPNGGRFDLLRACGLFLRSASRAHPFAEQSADLAEDLRVQLQGGASLCVAEEHWGGGPPQAFELGPGHRIVFAETSITLTYGDQDQRSIIGIPRGAVLLPIQYTPLTITRPTSTRRHFFQWFQWRPDKTLNPSTWTLDWALIEVVEGNWIWFKGENSIAMVNGRTPPESYDVGQLARITVSASGEAQVTIMGDAPRTEVIPPPGVGDAQAPSASAAIVAATPPRVAGETTTADGVAALAREDYQRAVEILKPIADDWRATDTIAQFFMAGLYEAGRGVPADPLRACAMYMRAASAFDGPFGREASALFTSSINRGKDFHDDCQYLAMLGFDNGFEPVTFNLGPGHDVEWTLRTATVTYDGRTQREQALVAQPGSRFLPLRHTELATGPTRALRRDFHRGIRVVAGRSVEHVAPAVACLRDRARRDHPDRWPGRSRHGARRTAAVARVLRRPRIRHDSRRR
jgi:hypothetical protein